jgi:hypothetical protein
MSFICECDSIYLARARKEKKGGIEPKKLACILIEAEKPKTCI